MATIKTPVAGVSPYQAAAATTPTVLRAGADGSTVLANPTAATAAAINANTNVIVNGAAALNSLITTGRTGVFEGANVTINLEEQNFNTTNQVTSNTNYPAGNIGEIQFNSGSNSFASDPYFTYASSNVITPGIRTDGYFYANGSPFIGGGNAAIGNFVFTGDTMSISDDANVSLNIRGNSLGNNENYITINPTNIDIYAYNTNPYSYSELYLDNSNVSAPYAQIIVDGNATPQQTWTFDATGQINIPAGSNSFDNGRIQSANGYPTLLGYGSGSHGGPELDWMDSDDPANAFGNSSVLRNTMYINDGGLFVGMNENEVANVAVVSWRFAPDGSTIFPTLTTQRGDNPSGTITGQTLLFGDATQEAIISTPDGIDAFPNSQRLVINPGQGFGAYEGGDIYLWAGRGGDASGSGGDIKIRGGQGGANTQGGVGGDGGYIRMEAGDAASTGGNPGYIDITGGYSNTVGGYVDITGGYGNTIGGEVKLYGGYGQATGGNVNIWGGASGNGQSNEGHVNIETGGNTWTFAADGNLTLPNNTFAVNYANGNPVVIGGGSGVSIVPNDVTYTNGSLYGNANPGFTVVTGQDDDDDAYSIPVDFPIEFLGNSYSSGNVWLVSNSYLTFGPDGADYTDYHPVGPVVVPVPAIYIGAMDLSNQKYYYGYADGTDVFVIGYEGSIETSGQENHPAIQWELQVNSATPDQLTIVVDGPANNGGALNFPAGVWGISNGSVWIDQYQPLPWFSNNNDDTYNAITIAPVVPVAVSTIAFTGPGVTYSENGGTTYINIDPFDEAISVGYDDDNSDAIISSTYYDLTLTTAQDGADLNIRPLGDVNIDAGSASDNQPGGGYQVNIHGGDAHDNPNAPGQNYNGGNVSIEGGSAVGNGTPGAVRVTSNGNTWIFGSTGNLTLPSNTASINYANGDPFSGGPVNTGNVTFNDQAVIGTGDQYGGSGLYLAPGTESVGNLQYLRVRGGDYPTHIHFDTGNNQYFDQYLGDDYKYVKLANTGNIVINSNDLIGNSAQWTFGTDGNLTTPGASGNITGADVISANVFTSITDVEIAASGNSWFFNTDGNLILPDNGVVWNNGGVTTLQAGTNGVQIGSQNSQSYVIADSLGVYIQNLADTTDNQWFFRTDGNLQVPGNSYFNTANATGGGGGNSVNIKAGASDANIYNSNSGGNILIQGGYGSYGNGNGGQGGNITIQSGGSSDSHHGNINIIADVSTWTFDYSGNLTFPTGNLVIIPDDAAFGNAAVISSADHNLITLSTGANGGTSSLWVEDYANIGSSNIAAVYANPVPGSGNVRIAVGTNGGPGPYLWDFQPNGNLTAPGNISTTGNITGVNNISTGTVTLTNGAVIKDTALYAVAFGQDAGLTSQGQEAVAIGHYAGRTSQGPGGVAIGVVAGNVNQGIEAVAIGAGAGRTDQGIQSIAIGSNAGQTSQGNNSIIINAAQGALDQTVANTFTVAPVRNDVANTGEVMFYNATSKEITYGNTISVTGNITAAYFSGNGSGLTGVGEATVPGQNILPTIQTITIAGTSGVGNAPGSGQGYANVTVANVISVTEYGVIITSGTSSQKYATGALGNIPGTEKITFTTAQTGAQFTVFAYVTSNAGTFYSNSATGNSGICLLAGTQIALSDGSHKAIEDITYTDKLLSWDFDRGCYAETTALWIKRSETGSQYNLLTFSDGTTLRTFDQHRIFNKQAGAFTYPMTSATPIGTITVNEHGQEITLINKQVIRDTIDYYNVITDHHMNLFSDSVLTSCRFNNIYPIVDMKFVKDSRTPRTRAEFANIPDRFFHGLRLAEQTADVETVEWYVDRLVATEVSTQVELAS